MKRLLIAVAALAVILAGCATMGGTSGITVLQSGSHSAMKDQSYKDFHNQADLDAFMATAFAKGDAPDLGKIDWTKNMVLAAFIGEQSNSGYRVYINKLDDSAPDSVQVHVRVTIPCSKESQPAKQSPFQIVTAPATTKTVNFADPEQDYLKC